jgi:hypothetical protein
MLKDKSYLINLESFLVIIKLFVIGNASWNSCTID